MPFENFSITTIANTWTFANITLPAKSRIKGFCFPHYNSNGYSFCLLAGRFSTGDPMVLTGKILYHSWLTTFPFTNYFKLDHLILDGELTFVIYHLTGNIPLIGTVYYEAEK